MGELSPKSSARQLWAEIERLRARESATDVERDAAQAAEIERAHARATHLQDELEAARGSAEAVGLAEEEFAGKPAIAKYRQAWARLTDAIWRLPTVAVEQGERAARNAIAARLDADLRLFELDAPRSESEARERDNLRRRFDDPAFAALLMDPAPYADGFRRQCVSALTRVYFRPAIWRLYGRAPDEGAIDKLGTVYK